jgi:8-oxo-dGTP diphosphatase
MREGNKRRIVIVAACALVDGEGRLLITRRPAGKPLAGLWEFPGGKVETDEAPEAALIRELREELALDVAVADLQPLTFASHAYPDFHLLMPVYLCRKWQGSVTPLEGQEILWVKPSELHAYDMPPADEPLKTALRDL